MTLSEWESLCDRCGQCCLHKFEDEKTGEAIFTYIACHLLDREDCSCTDYEQRLERVTACLKITPDNFKKMHLLPQTCAYRKLATGKTLAWWHPLISGNPETVHQAEVSVRGKFISEENVHSDDFEAYILNR